MKIVFVASWKGEIPSFIKQDLDILRENYEVTVFKKPEDVRRLFSLFMTIRKSDVVFAWFLGPAFFSTLFAKILRRKVIVVPGGYDVIYDSDIDYGALRDRNSMLSIKYILDNSDYILPVSKDIEERVRRITKNPKIKMIYHGLDANKFTLGNKKRDLVITVGYLSQWLRKGQLEFIRSIPFVLKKKPSVKFKVIGRKQWLEKKTQGFTRLEEEVRKLGIQNTVEFLGWVDDLVPILQETKVYVQPSRHEGFGCSVAEAMLCGCIPVVTSMGALPEVVGPTGVYVSLDPKQIALGVISALEETSEQKRLLVREYIKNNFSLDKRKRSLLEVLETISPQVH